MGKLQNSPATVYLVQRLGRIQSIELATTEDHLLRHERSFAENSQEYSEVQHCTPEPMARVVSGSLLQVSPEEDNGEGESDLAGMVSGSIARGCAYTH